MKIAIDARWIFHEISGIGAYTRELIRNLATLDSENSYELIFSDPALLERTVQETGISGVRNFKTVLVPYGVFSPLGQIRLPGLLRQHGVDIYHSTNYMIPLLAFSHRQGPMKCVVTIHDVIPMIFPHHAPHSKKSRLFPIYRALMREIGLRATSIVTDSEASLKDIIHHLQLDPARAALMRVIYCGVGSHFVPPATRQQNEVRTVLYVGRADPYKNIPVLIQAFARAQKTSPLPMRLRLVGANDPRYPEPRRLADTLGISAHIDWTGYLSDADMVKAYQNADVLVHPSQYEGFGLQVAEAMACGLPVICSRGGSLPEVAGDAAILHDATDVSGFSESLLRVLSDAKIAETMRQKGLRNAARFSWEKAARATLTLYKELGKAQ